MKTFPAIFIFSLTTLLIACGKDKYESKPRLEFKDYDRIVDSTRDLTIRISYFDKEGDLNEAEIIGIKERLNNFPPPSINLGDTFRNILPEYPPKDFGEITFQLNYSRLDESVNQNDTVRFRFAVTDKAGNKSDTITTDMIVARKP
ncbi:MAG: hypothetical protein ABI675_27885 [Chitinophagaceae bacterium]